MTAMAGTSVIQINEGLLEGDYSGDDVLGLIVNDQLDATHNMVSKLCPSIYNETKETASQFTKQVTSPNFRLLFVLDVLLCQFVLSPLVISNWAYAWQIADASGKNLISSAICCLIGSLVLITLCFCQSYLKRHAVSSTGEALPVIASAYNIVVALATVLNWRGVWTAMDIWLGVDLWSCISSSFLGLGILVGTGTTKTSAMSAPFFSMSDHQLRRGGEQYDFPTRFRQKRGPKLLLDCIFTIHAPTIGVVCLWRALWIPQDLLINFDDDDDHRLRSNLLSCLAGWISAVLLVCLQPYTDTLCQRLEARAGWWSRFALESLWSVIQSLSVVLLWRGIWNLSDAYLGDMFPDVPKLHACLTMLLFTTLALEVLSMNSNTGGKGCGVDGYGIGNYICYLTPLQQLSIMLAYCKVQSRAPTTSELNSSRALQLTNTTETNMSTSLVVYSNYNSSCFVIVASLRRRKNLETAAGNV